jgi:serine protease Do
MKIGTINRSLGIALLALTSTLMCSPGTFGEQENQQDTQKRDTQERDTQERDTQEQATEESDETSRASRARSKEHVQYQSRALGVVVGSCPGEAVCVYDVLRGSPAEEAGVQAGDYILSVDGQKITNPATFKKMLDQKDADQQIQLKVWRQNQEFDRPARLAIESQKLPDSHATWLGVLLGAADNDDPGVEIQQVIPGSPADKAGLQSGDIIVRLNEKDVKNVEGFVERVHDFSPGTDLTLQVRRDGSERNVNVTLGTIRNAPMRFLREVFTDLMDDSPFQSNQRQVSAESLELIDQTLDQMRQQIQTLEEQIRELRREKEGARGQRENDSENDADRNRSSQSSRDPSGDEQTVLPGLSAFTANFVSAPISSSTIQQQDGQRMQWGRNWGQGRGTNWNTWQYPNWNRYQGFIPQHRFYSYPQYGQWYFQQGGRPYYYGRYGQPDFGPRYGLRSGTNFFWY